MECPRALGRCVGRCRRRRRRLFSRWSETMPLLDELWLDEDDDDNDDDHGDFSHEGEEKED